MTKHTRLKAALALDWSPAFQYVSPVTQSKLALSRNCCRNNNSLFTKFRQRAKDMNFLADLPYVFMKASVLSKPKVAVICLVWGIFLIFLDPIKITVFPYIYIYIATKKHLQRIALIVFSLILFVTVSCTIY